VAKKHVAKKGQYDQDAILKDERLWQELYMADKIAGLVVANIGQVEVTGDGLMLCQACVGFRERLDNRANWTRVSELADAALWSSFVLQWWEKMLVEARRRVCNGWMVPLNLPKKTELLNEWMGKVSNTDHFLVLGCAENGHVFSTVETQLADGATDPVRVFVRSGSTREDAMAALTSAMQTLNRQWDTLIATPSVEATAATTTPSPSSVGAEKKPRTGSRKPVSKLGGKNGKVAAVAA